MKRTALLVLGIMIMITATLIPSDSFAAGHTVSISSINATCFATCNGSATANVTGGTGPFSYSWAPSGGTNATENGLCAGNYTVTVTDLSDMSTATASVAITQPTQITLSPSSTPSCASSCTGSATSIASGGTSPYTYLWNNNVTTVTNSGICAGTYTLVVTDANGCSATNTVTVSAYPAISPVITMSDDTICVGNTSQLTVTSNGGTTYSWAPASSLSAANTANPVASPTVTTTYTVTVSNAQGCTETATTTVYVDNIGLVVSPPNPTICAGSSIVLTASSSSISNSVNYYWAAPLNFTSPNAIVTPTATTTYTITATSTSGCNQSTTVTVTVAPVPSVTASPVIAGCSQANGSIISNVTGGSPPYFYQWSTTPTQTASTATGLAAGIYTLTVTDVNGCAISNITTLIDSCGFVWPGDADEDLTADNNDVLAIGFAYGATGPVRVGATNSWIGQGATNWGMTLPSGADYKYTDCNGDGVIDNNDTLAISLNYGNTHTYRLPAPSTLTTNPNIYLVASADSAGLQTLINVDVMMGTSTTPIDSIYGVAFTLSFDPSLVDSAFTAMDYTGSWIGTSGVNMLPFSKAMHLSGLVDVAIVGTNHQNRSGYGKIATLKIVTTDNLSGLSVLPVNISNINALRLSGNAVPMTPMGDSIVVDPVLAINTIDLDRLVSLYPNPASSTATLVMPGNIADRIFIADLTGRSIMSIDQPSSIMHIDLSQLPAGMYQVIIHTAQGNVNKKLNVIH